MCMYVYVPVDLGWQAGRFAGMMQRNVRNTPRFMFAMSTHIHAGRVAGRQAGRTRKGRAWQGMAWHGRAGQGAGISNFASLKRLLRASRQARRQARSTQSVPLGGKTQY
jgi:hypothetical protein